MEIRTVIRYQDDIHFLEGIPSDKRAEYIRNAITIGLRSIQMSEFTMDGRSYLDPIRTIMDDQGSKIMDMGDKLDNLLHVRTNSSRKGKLSENICIRALEDRYPSTEFRDTAKEPHCGDCRGKFLIGDVMYEFKDYENVVNSGEIAKFHRDLETTAIKFGVFVSNTSGITGKKSVEWAIVGRSTIAVYVSQLGINGLGCIVGTEFLLALQEAMVLDSEKGWIMRHDIQFTEYQERFSECVDEYCSHVEKVSRLGNSLHEAQKKVLATFEPLHRDLLNLKLDMEGTFRQMVGLKDDIEENREVSHQEFDYIEFIENCSNPKFNKLYETLIKLSRSESLQLRCSEQNLVGYRDETQVFKTVAIKTKMSILFPMKDDIINLNVRHEVIKGSKIQIEVKDESLVWELIRGRLAKN